MRAEHRVLDLLNSKGYSHGHAKDNGGKYWRFGVFEFDARSAGFRRAGVPIKLRARRHASSFISLNMQGRW